MSAPTPNVPLLRKAVEWVEEQAALPTPERTWDQDWWRTEANEYRRSEGYCQTTYCVAGKLCEDAGAQWLNNGAVQMPDGTKAHPAKAAAGLLGVSGDQGTRLFNASNTAADVRRIAEEIAGERL